VAPAAFRVVPRHARERPAVLGPGLSAPHRLRQLGPGRHVRLSVVAPRAAPCSRATRVRSAHALDPTWVALTASRGLETPALKLYMRATVLACDLLVYVPAVLYLAAVLHRRAGPLSRAERVRMPSGEGRGRFYGAYL
jgi:hypothetical protein